KHKTEYGEILQQQQAIELLKPKLLEPTRRQEISSDLAEKEAVCKPLEEALEQLKKQLELKNSIDRNKAEIARLEQEKNKAVQALEIFRSEHGQPLLQHEKVRPFSEELRKWSSLQEESNELKNELLTRRREEDDNLSELQRCLKATGDFTKAEITKENIIEKLGESQEKIASLQEARRQKLEVHNNIKSRLDATLSEVSSPWQQEPEARLLLLEDLKATSEAKLKKFKKELQIDLENLSGERQQLRQRLEVSRKAQMEWVQLEQL